MNQQARPVNDDRYVVVRRTKTTHLLSKVFCCAMVTALIVDLGASRLLMAQDQGDGAWKVWGHDLKDSHNSSAEHILSPNNVNQLAVKWIFTTGGDVSATPTVEGNAVYVPDWGGNLFRIDASTGVAVWSKKVSEYTGIAGSFSRNSPTIAGNKLLIGETKSGTLMAIDKGTGNLIWKTMVEPHPAARMTSSTIVFKERVYVGMSSDEEEFSLIPGYQLSFRRSISAVVLDSGAIIWKTYIVPQGYTGGAI